MLQQIRERLAADLATVDRLMAWYGMGAAPAGPRLLKGPERTEAIEGTQAETVTVTRKGGRAPSELAAVIEKIVANWGREFRTQEVWQAVQQRMKTTAMDEARTRAAISRMVKTGKIKPVGDGVRPLFYRWVGAPAEAPRGAVASRYEEFRKEIKTSQEEE